MHSYDDVVLGRVRVGHIRQGESTDAGIAVLNGDGLHRTPSLAEWSMCAR